MWSDAARAASAAARKGAGGGNPAITPGTAKAVVKGALASVDRNMAALDASRAQFNADPANAAAARVLSGNHPKAGLVGIHSASAISRGITKARLAFRNSAG